MTGQTKALLVRKTNTGKAVIRIHGTCSRALIKVLKGTDVNGANILHFPYIMRSPQPPRRNEVQAILKEDQGV